MKKSFNKDILMREKNLAQLLDNVNNMDNSTRESVIKTLENPTKENVIKTVEIIKDDTIIDKDFKDSLIKQLQYDYFDLFNPNNCPEDYESLKKKLSF